MGIGIAILVMIGFLGLIVIGNLGPPAGIVTWEELGPRNKRSLSESGIVTDENGVLFLYSASLTDIREDLYVLTENAVVIHETVDGELQHWEVPIDSILALYVVYSNTWLEDSVLVVEDQEYLYTVSLSTDSGRDREFVAKLEQLSELTASEIEADDSE